MAIKINKNIVIEDTNVALKDLPEVYSTNEVKTNGTWVDGKPIYRKVITGHISSTPESYVDISSLKVGAIIKISGTITSANGLSWDINNSAATMPNYNVYWYRQSANNLQLGVGSQFNTSSPYSMIIEYTKTTD